MLLSCDYCHHLPFTEKAEQSLLWMNPVSLGCAWELLRVSTLRLMYAVTLCVWCRGTESQHPGVHDEGYGKTRSVWCTEVDRAGDGRKEEGREPEGREGGSQHMAESDLTRLNLILKTR